MEEKSVETVAEGVGVEKVAKEDYDKVVAEYQKLTNAFYKLLNKYNEMFVSSLFTEDNKG